MDITTIQAQLANLVESVVGEVEAANVDLDQFGADEAGWISVGDPDRDGSLVIRADDTVEVWAQGDVAETYTIDGAHAAYAAMLDGMPNAHIAAAALRDAQQLLADAWRQLDLAGKTETDPADAALSAAMNEIRAIRNGIAVDPADEDAQIVQAATEARTRQRQAEAARDELYGLIRRSGRGPSRLGELADVSPQRIAQIRRGTRSW